MPDDDRFRWELRAKWLRVQRSISAGHDIGRIADLLVKAVAADLRQVGGIRAGAGAAEARSGSGVSWSETILDGSSVSSRHYSTIKAAVRLAEPQAASPLRASQAVARELIASIMDDGFARMLPLIVVTGSMTAVEFADLRDVLGRHPQVAKLLENLVKHPDARGLSAPRRTVPLTRAADLLNTDLSEL